MIICSIYGTCKGHSEVSFSKIVDQYKKIFNEDEAIYLKVLIEEGTFENVIQFYNKVFMPNMKEFLIDMHNGKISLNSEMYQQNSLRACAPSVQMQHAVLSSLKSPLRSPFMTPRTQKLIATNSPLPMGQTLSLGTPLLFDDKGDPNKRFKLPDRKPDEAGPVPCLKKGK